uniref:Glucuronate isomerase n=1 Tax=Ignisphaera aggregans TaxID=334771 RepID=A0A7C4D0V0_9CREN
MQNIIELANKLYNEIQGIDVVDIHEHLNPSRLSAKSFNDIIFYHYIVTELISAGMNREEFEKLSPIDRFAKVLPYFKFIRNTATFWSLKQILKDLYGLDINEINESNWKKVVESIESKGSDSTWVYTVLRKFCRVKKSFLTLSPLEPIPIYDRDIFTGALRLDVLVQNMSKDVILDLENRYSLSIERIEDLDHVLEIIFNRFDQHIVAVTLPIQPDDIFRITHRNEVSLYLRELRSKGAIGYEAKCALASYILHKILTLCSEHKKVFQMMLGVKRPVPKAAPPDYAIIMYNPEQLYILAQIFAIYSDVKFDVFIADSTLSHQVTVIAKNYPNVYLSGYWWYSMYPEIIKSYLRLRLQMLPYNKIGGFFSDAYVIEWVYGKILLAKKQIAYVLVEMITEGYIDNDLAMDIAHALLHENATKLYNV